jgi:hypothetical protein
MMALSARGREARPKSAHLVLTICGTNGNEVEAIHMGRTYWFECVKCGYRAKLSGGADRGLNLFVQTILCRECRELCDAVTRLKVPTRLAPGLSKRPSWRFAKKSEVLHPPAVTPPRFQEAVNRLLYLGALGVKWVQFKLQCPVSALHRVEPWNEPGRCPKCGLDLEKNALPFRIWD